MPSEFKSCFGHAAAEFQKFRPEYPPEVFAHILAAVPEGLRESAMDLGAGTGKSTRRLIPHFREVIAVEPDVGMAAKLHEELPKVIVRNVTAEECVQPRASVDLVTIGNALHWMDARRVFENIHPWLRSGGVLAVYDRPLPKASPEIDAITLAELRGPWKPHRDPRLKRDFVWRDQVHDAAGFEIVEETKFSQVIPMSPHDYVGFWRSTSYGSAYGRTLVEPEGYWNDLESRFAEASRGEPIPVDVSPTLIIARKSERRALGNLPL